MLDILALPMIGLVIAVFIIYVAVVWMRTDASRALGSAALLSEDQRAEED